MTRTGKIARLPKPIRDQLNRQLADGVPGVKLVEWLNSLPETQQLLTERFDGREINEPNLSEWKTGGYLDWEAQQDLLASVQALAEKGIDLQAMTGGKLAEHLSTAVAGRYAQLLSHWNGEVDERFLKKLKGLRLLCQDVAVLRRGELRAKALELKSKYYEDAKRDEEIKALEVCLEEAKEYPEAQAMFRKAFVLRKAYLAGKKRNRDYEDKVARREMAKAERRRLRQVEKMRLRNEKEKQERQAAEAKVAARKARWAAAHPGMDPIKGRWWEWQPEGGEAGDFTGNEICEKANEFEKIKVN